MTATEDHRRAATSVRCPHLALFGQERRVHRSGLGTKPLLLLEVRRAERGARDDAGEAPSNAARLGDRAGEALEAPRGGVAHGERGGLGGRVLLELRDSEVQRVTDIIARVVVVVAVHKK